MKKNSFSRLTKLIQDRILTGYSQFLMDLKLKKLKNEKDVPEKCAKAS
jgi:hypothetical protein